MKVSNQFETPDRYRLSHFLQAIPIYIFYLIFRSMPIDWASSLGGWIGRSFGPRLGAHKKALKNLEIAVPELKDNHQKILLEMWDNLGRAIAESPHTHKFVNSNRIEVVGFEHVENLKEQNIPAIICSTHSANWEIIPIAFRSRETTLTVVYRPPNNLFVDWLLKRTRRFASPRLVPKGKQAALGVIKTLKKGGYVGWLIDQKESAGIKVNFFGKPAFTSTGPAEIAIKTKAQLLFCKIERLQGAYFRLTIHPPVRIENHKVETATQLINDILEKDIRSNIGQWLWLHRRWSM